MNSLEQWTNYLQQRSPPQGKQSLTHINQVAQALHLNHSTAPVISIAGTNGKGTTANTLSSLYTQQGYQVGCFTSPHLFSVCERIQINHRPISEHTFVTLCQWLHQHPLSKNLSYFEWLTIIALQAFKQADVALIILEVGMGGRLDATQCLANNLAIITSIDLDHTEYLGHNRTMIAYEKAGIIQKNTPVILGMATPLPILLHHTKQQKSRTFINHQAFNLTLLPNGWQWENTTGTVWKGTKTLTLPPDSISCALQAITLFSSTLPVDAAVIQTTLDQLTIPGRFTTLTYQKHTLVFDVAHNPASIKRLKSMLLKHFPNKKCHLICAWKTNKDYPQMMHMLTELDAQWFLATHVPESLTTAAQLIPYLDSTQHYNTQKNLIQAFTSALKSTPVHDIIVVCGSFLTVGMVKRYIDDHVSHSLVKEPI
jgi:dihydrofolate synthase / folylpolyglutamate synthase